MSRVARIALNVCAVLYPVGVFFSLGRLEPRWLAVPLLLLAIGRALQTRRREWWLASLGAAVLAVVCITRNDVMPLKLYPVLVNATLLAVFGWSLVFPPTVIERLARITEPELPPSGVEYTRKVTWVWSAFFVLNGSVALGTALFASERVWALYNGLIAYGLMGVLFAGEYLVRLRVKSRVHADV